MHTYILELLLPGLSLYEIFHTLLECSHLTGMAEEYECVHS